MSDRQASRPDAATGKWSLRERDKGVGQDATGGEVGPSATRLAFILLAGANFGVALGYGIVLPFVPLFVEQVSGAAPLGAHALHTGALLGIYPFAIFLAAPLWGCVADRVGGRRVLAIGLAGYAVALMAFAFTPSLTGAYVLRALAGLAAGAVLPVVAATVGAVIDLRWRARLFAAMSVATLLGLLAGPAVSGAAYTAMARVGGVLDWEAIVGPPILGAATFVILLLAGIVRWMPPPMLRTSAAAARGRVDWRQARFSLIASFILLLGLGAFEAVLPLLGKTRLPIDTAALGLLLAGCMLVMLVVEVTLFLTPILHGQSGGGSIAMGFLVMAAGAALLSTATSMGVVATAVGLLAAGAAFLQPAIAYAATLKAGGASGALLGGLTAAGSLGQATGSFVGGGLFSLVEARALWLVAAALLLTAVGSNAVPRREA